MGCVTSFLILAHVLAPLSGVLYTTHFLVKSKSKFSALLQQLWEFVLVFSKHRRWSDSPAFQLKPPSSWQQVKAKNVGCFVQYFYPIFFNMLAVNKRFVYNKKIKSPAGAGWDAYTWAASHFSPRVCAPYLKVRHQLRERHVSEVFGSVSNFTCCNIFFSGS